MKANNLVYRTLTGIVFLVLVIGAILWNKFSFSSLFLLITILGLSEFFSLVTNIQAKPNKVLGILTGLVFYILNALFLLGYIEKKYIVLSLLPVFIVFIAELYRNKEQPITNIAFLLLGNIYITLPCVLMNYVGLGIIDANYHMQVVLGILILIWANDTMAYVFGASMGKHKLWERISPKKSWEGFFGGMIGCIGAAFVLAYFFSDLTAIEWLVIAAIVVAFGTLGDLIESLFKRTMNTKDSGSLLPGHGGILDRFDAAFLVVPFVFVFLLLKFIK